MSYMNRLANAGNKYQGTTKKILCVCSAGLLRSPTLAHVLSSPPYNFNTRAAGITREYALVPVDDVLLQWADEVIAVEKWIGDILRDQLEGKKPVHVIELEDKYEYRDPYLVKLIEEALEKLYGPKDSSHV